MNRTIISTIYFVCFSILLSGCLKGNSLDNNIPDYVNNPTFEKAILTIKENHSEIETVLNYYKNEPEKLEAVKFLIKNMPLHYSLKNTEKTINYYNQLDSLFHEYKNSADDDNLELQYSTLLNRAPKEYEEISQFYIPCNTLSSKTCYWVEGYMCDRLSKGCGHFWQDACNGLCI